MIIKKKLDDSIIIALIIIINNNGTHMEHKFLPSPPPNILLVIPPILILTFVPLLHEVISDKGAVCTLCPSRNIFTLFIPFIDKTSSAPLALLLRCTIAK